MRSILFALLYTVVCLEACTSNGVCGCCAGRCRAKARAKAALTREDTSSSFPEDDDGNIFGLSIWNKTSIRVDEETLPLLTNPNHLFHRCCEERGLPSACVRYCHFNEYTGKSLENIFFSRDACPIKFVPEMQFCAAQGSDHRECCSRSEVATTSAGNKCLLFCDQRPDKFSPIDYSYTPCLHRFENMKKCFFFDIMKKALMKFGAMKQQKELELNDVEAELKY